MKLFLDSGNLAEIEDACTWGVLSGITTNPSLLAKDNHKDMKSIIQKIAGLLPQDPISAEVVSEDAKGMIEEGVSFSKWAPNIMVKVPFCLEGMKAVRYFSDNNIQTNVTLVFSANQALLAANAGATVISSFVGRLDDIGHDGIQVIADAAEMMNLHNFKSEILAASIRHPLHVTQSAQAGAHIATIPYKVLKQMYYHPLTESGTQQFLADWKKLQAVTA
jgi:transaldolase